MKHTKNTTTTQTTTLATNQVTTFRITLVLLLAMFGFSAPAFADDYSIRKSAYKLDRAATKLYDRAHYQYGYSPVTYKAKEFSRAAHRFCADVERGVSFRRLWKEYGRLQNRHYELERALDRANRRYARHGYGHDDDDRHGKGLRLGKVNKWFARLDRAMDREHAYNYRGNKRHRGYGRNSRARDYDALDYALNVVFETGNTRRGYD